MARHKKNDEDKKTFGVRVRLAERDYEKLKSVSERFDMSMSQTIRVLIKEADNIVKRW